MSWKSKLHPAVSRAEEQVFAELSRLGLTKGMVTQKTIVLKSTIPDFQWDSKRKALYLDGEQAHRGREEWDEEVENLLEKRGWKVLRIRYAAPLTTKNLTRILDEIQQWLGE